MLGGVRWSSARNWWWVIIIEECHMSLVFGCVTISLNYMHLCYLMTFIVFSVLTHSSLIHSIHRANAIINHLILVEIICWRILFDTPAITSVYLPRVRCNYTYINLTKIDFRLNWLNFLQQMMFKITNCHYRSCIKWQRVKRDWKK